MKFLALGTPLLVLGLIFVLQRLESWVLPPARPGRRQLAAAPAGNARGTARFAPRDHASGGQEENDEARHRIRPR